MESCEILEENISEYDFFASSESQIALCKQRSITVYPSKATINTINEDVQAIAFSKSETLVCCTGDGLSFYET